LSFARHFKEHDGPGLADAKIWALVPPVLTYFAQTYYTIEKISEEIQSLPNFGAITSDLRSIWDDGPFSRCIYHILIYIHNRRHEQSKMYDLQTMVEGLSGQFESYNLRHPNVVQDLIESETFGTGVIIVQTFFITTLNQDLKDLIISTQKKILSALTSGDRIINYSDWQSYMLVATMRNMVIFIILPVK
jgi:hypothetical protein